jgi:hypothetical protein
MTIPIIPPFAVKAGYQNSQYATGTYTQGGSQVFSHLVTPPSSGVSAETAADTAAQEVGFSAYNASSEVQVITVVGAPTGGTFLLEWGAQTTAPIAYSATSTTVRNALAALTNIPTVVGLPDKQTFTMVGAPTGGTFTITFGGQTTAAIAFNAAASAVQTAFQALSSVGAGNATVAGNAGGPWTITFAGALATGAQSVATTTGASLTGGTTPSVSVTHAQTGTASTFAVAVSGSAGGPWTVTFQNALANEDVSLISANGDALTGGTDPHITTVTSVNGTVAFANAALQDAHRQRDGMVDFYDQASGNHF